MPFTTGIITNTRDFGTAATNIVINTRNLDTVNVSVITVLIYASTTSSSFSPLYLASYAVPPNGFDVRTFFISGNVAYEVQLQAAGLTPNNVNFTVFGIDQFGNLVTNQRVLQTELSSIPALSS